MNKRIIGVASGKGGVGKTSIITNLAKSYANIGKRVLLIDLDCGNANAHLLFKVFPKYTIYDVLYHNYSWEQITNKVNDNLDLISVGYGLSEISNLTQEDRNKIMDFIKTQTNKYDVVLLDCMAGEGKDITDFLSVCDKIIMVIMAVYSSVTGAYTVLKNLNKGYERVPEVFVLTNHFLFKKNKLVEKEFLFYKNLQETYYKYFNKQIKYLGNIIHDNDFFMSYNNQDVFVDKYGHSKIAKQIQNIGEILCPVMKRTESKATI